MRDRDLRASLAKIGALQPGYAFEGELIDGRRRQPLLIELGRPFEIRELASLEEACATLWPLHPDRALDLAGPHSIIDIAALCGTTTSAVASQMQARKPRRVHRRQNDRIEKQPYERLRATPKMLQRLVTLEPELYAYSREAAAQAGHNNWSRLVRDALWEKITQLVPNAPMRPPRRVDSPNGARRRTG